ncbi:hypothetical protein NKG05_24005 [Oerskovia sp. M15]
MRILRTALVLQGVFAVGLLVVALTGAGGLIGLLAALWLTLSLQGLIPANASALALSRHGEMAGTAAAVIGAFQAGVAGLVSPLVGVLGGDEVAMSAVMLGRSWPPCSCSGWPRPRSARAGGTCPSDAFPGAPGVDRGRSGRTLHISFARHEGHTRSMALGSSHAQPEDRLEERPSSRALPALAQGPSRRRDGDDRQPRVRRYRCRRDVRRLPERVGRE